MPPADSAAPTSTPVAGLSPRLAQFARDLVRPNLAVDPEHCSEQVLAHFSAHPELDSLPVLEDGHPIGLINRNVFMTSFAMPFRRELFARKSCAAFMDKAPLVVDEETPIGELCRLASRDGGKALRDGFIITRAGRYVGIGLGNDLLVAVADLQADRNRQILESIDYASVIQKSFMRPSCAALAGFFGDRHRLIWEPRDVVGGDCYFASPTDDGLLFVLMDCTGHGVPGALMTMIVMAFADHATAAVDASRPAAVLAAVNRMVKTALDQREHRVSRIEERRRGLAAKARSDDGMDAAALWIAADGRRARFAGAHLPLLVQRAGADELEVIDGDRYGVGYVRTPDGFAWSEVDLPIGAGDRLFMASDGLIDQIGGPQRFAFGNRRLREVLLATGGESLETQIERLWARFVTWQGDERRRDDVTLLGLEA